jgi:hypothetical protein
MKKHLSNPWIWGAAAVVSLAAHAWWACSRHDVTLAARCGATWVVFAFVIIARPIIRVGYTAWYQSRRTIDCGTFPATPQQEEENRQRRTDENCVQLYGPTLAVFGTILWAYGDLLIASVAKNLCLFAG